MPLDTDLLLEYFRNREGHGRGQMLHNAAFYLLHRILEWQRFDDLDSLTAFCRDPENLEPWLPSESDRVILSAGLTDGLQEFCGLTPWGGLSEYSDREGFGAACCCLYQG